MACEFRTGKGGFHEGEDVIAPWRAAAIIALADLVLIPVQPSPLDAWAIGDTVNIARNAGKPYLFVMTEANAQANITAQTIAALSHHGPVAGGRVATEPKVRLGPAG